MAEKLCKDCKWFRKGFLQFYSYEFAECKCPKTIKQTLVGKTEREFIYCNTYRMASSCSDYDCGSEGKFWEPKK